MRQHQGPTAATRLCDVSRWEGQAGPRPSPARDQVQAKPSSLKSVRTRARWGSKRESSYPPTLNWEWSERVLKQAACSTGAWEQAMQYR